MRAREEAETARVAGRGAADAREMASIKTEEQLGDPAENQAREVAVAEKNRERVIAIETERIEKDRELEVIARERGGRAVSGSPRTRSSRSRARTIAEVVRERIAVDKTVAEQEERIKGLRGRRGGRAARQDVVIIAAEAEAQEQLVKDIKAAEAAEKAAELKAREELILAEAALEAADSDAQAKIRLAEGVAGRGGRRGPRRGPGQGGRTRTPSRRRAWPQARVDARLQRPRRGEEEQGMARIRVKDARGRGHREGGAVEADGRGVAEKLIAEADAVSGETRRRGRGAGARRRDRPARCSPRPRARRNAKAVEAWARRGEVARSVAPRPAASPRRPRR